MTEEFNLEIDQNLLRILGSAQIFYLKLITERTLIVLYLFCLNVDCVNCYKTMRNQGAGIPQLNAVSFLIHFFN